jgi:glyoxylase-like metal-dependent hydrolase (beta-lactamase superfamily II)
MSIDPIERIEGRVLPVNTFLVRGPEGVVVVDGMLTVSDAARVREAIDDMGLPVAGVVVTHPHPDHYAGLAHLVDGRRRHRCHQRGRRDHPPRRPAQERGRRPHDGRRLADDTGVPQPHRQRRRRRAARRPDAVVRELGPGESHVDSLWLLDARTIFAGDVAYNGMHIYLADGHWRDWLATLDRLDAELPDDATLYVGHGPPGGKDLLAAQRRYIDTFVDAVGAHADAIDHGDHSGVIEAMQRLLPTDSLLFLMDLSIEPTLATLR